MQELQRNHFSVYTWESLRPYSFSWNKDKATRSTTARANWCFTPHRSTLDTISTLSKLLETRREFNKPLWIAYVDLKSAFDYVDRESLWLLLRRHGIPSKIV